VLTRPPDDDPLFVVDDGHLGTAEDVWLADDRLAGLRPLELPAFSHVVLVAAHPDDEILGAGGLVQVLGASSCTIELCSATDGEASHPAVGPALGEIRTAEAACALRRLGAASVRPTRLGLPDGDLVGNESRLAEYLSGRLSDRSLCVAPWRHDGHPDHEAAGRAAAAAAAATGASLLEFPIWAWHWATPTAGLPWDALRRLELDPVQLQHKRSAIAAFASQIQPYGPGATSAILPPATLERFQRPFEVYVA
jgi:LmbE family N-acetylglucosaminyl deacetylase